MNQPKTVEIFKYQQFGHGSTCSILVSYVILVKLPLVYGAISNNLAHIGGALISWEALKRRRRLFQWGYPKVEHLLEGGAYLRPGAY